MFFTNSPSLSTWATFTHIAIGKMMGLTLSVRNWEGDGPHLVCTASCLRWKNTPPCLRSLFSAMKEHRPGLVVAELARLLREHLADLRNLLVSFFGTGGDFVCTGSKHKVPEARPIGQAKDQCTN